MNRAITVRYVRRDRNQKRYGNLLHLRRQRQGEPLGIQARLPKAWLCRLNTMRQDSESLIGVSSVAGEGLFVSFGGKPPVLMEVECRMAVDAGTKRSFFTQQLEKRLEQEGITTPSFVLDLLDKPFSSFSDKDRQLYEKQVKEKELLVLFARLLKNIYDASGDSTKHSWKGMCHLLKDSPIKVCVSFVLNQEEEQEIAGDRAAPESARSEVRGAGAREARPAAPRGAAAEDDPGLADGDATRKSYFTKKLERKLHEREIKVPASIIALLDKPFDDFTTEEQSLYESEFKGRQLTILFSDILDELYDETGRVSSGWNALCRYLKDTPMKLIATYVVQEEERLEEVAEIEEKGPAGPETVREKYNVKRYQPAKEEEKDKERHSRFRRK